MTALPQDGATGTNPGIAEIEQSLRLSTAENELLQRELALSRDRQEASAEILRTIASSRGDAARSLQHIAETCGRLFDVPSVSIQLAENGQWSKAYRYGTSAQYVRSTIPLAMITVDGPNMPGQVITRNEQIHIPDLDHIDPSMAEWPGLPLARAAGTRTMCGTPLRRGEKAIGALLVYRDRLLPFTPEELALLQSFADQAVIAIENARLFNETQEALEQQTATADILKVIASSPTDVGPVLQAIVDSACKLCGAHDAVVHLRLGDDLHYGAHHGPIPVGFQKRRLTRNFITGRAVIDRVSVHLRDVLSAEGADFPEAQELSRRQGTRTLLTVPLLRDDESIGAIVLRRTEVRPFSDKEIALLQTFADQAVIALGNVRLFEEVQARTRDLTESLQQQTATSEVLQVISNSSGDLQPVFDTMLANATKICSARFGMMWLTEGSAARCVALHNAPEAFAELRRREPVIHPGPENVMGQMMINKEVVQIEDAMADKAYIEGNPIRRANTDLAGARTILAVPMLRENELVGAITIYRQEVRPFSEKQIELVTHFAKQAVIAIENARLLNELRDRTDELSRSLDDLRTAQDRLIQTEKLASLGQLTAGIAHEIKNPLNFVNNFSALSTELIDELNEALKSIAIDNKAKEEIAELTHMLKANLEKVVQHGKRADSIVKNMLMHSREGSGERRSASINGLVEESLNLAYHGARAEKAGFNITLKYDLDPHAGAVELYPQEITRALLNLISNGFYAAIKRKAEEPDETFEPVLSAATRNLGKRVEIRIRDNGTGIPPEVREKMFNPFFTTKPTGEGTGLGLSMSHDIIVKQHGGRIDVQTEPGEFTEFIVILPRDATAPSQPGSRSES